MNSEQTTLCVVVCIVMTVFVGWAVLHGLAPKPSPFIEPVALCPVPGLLTSDGFFVYSPCIHVNKTQDI